MMKIIVKPAEYRYREHQWTATVGDYDLDDPIGSGMSDTLTLAELRYSLEAAVKHLARLPGRLPDAMPPRTEFLIGKAVGSLQLAVELIDGKLRDQ